MEIKVDYRETDLIAELKKTNLQISIENLPIGDIIFLDGNKELLIIERKTLQDLASSLRDGRYAEQSFRLDKHPLHNHNIIYLIEGILDGSYSYKYTKVKPDTIQSCMFSLNYFKGFTVVQTKSKLETVQYISKVFDKIKREHGKKTAYYDNKVHLSESYSTVVKKQKKEYVTPEIIGEIFLSQIPSVSKKTAKAVMEKYYSIGHLIDVLRVNKTCLDELTLNISNGKKRKLSKNSIKNIKSFLLYTPLLTIV